VPVNGTHTGGGLTGARYHPNRKRVCIPAPAAASILGPKRFCFNTKARRKALGARERVDAADAAEAVEAGIDFEDIWTLVLVGFVLAAVVAATAREQRHGRWSECIAEPPIYPSSRGSSKLSSANHMTRSAGDQLGPYEILAPIGKGGMGEVYRARDSRMGREVAIKVSKGQFSERFDREGRRAGRAASGRSQPMADSSHAGRPTTSCCTRPATR
jgi:hypothetical protein